ncbi:MAG: S8 family serine peptidase [Deltaproteobacteria bacterium]|nr:S8 family serine peptidase [Deltaproteobacteria bacterium]
MERLAYQIRQKVTSTVRCLLAMAAAIAVISVADRVSAEEHECIKGQYVMSLPVRGLKKQAEQTLEEVSSDGLLVVKESTQRPVILLETEEEFHDNDNVEIEAVPFSKKQDLCERLEKKRRNDLRIEKASGRVSVKSRRRWDCSCNTVMYVNDTLPNDQYFPYLWGLSQSNDIDIDAPEAWDLWKGNSSTIIAVIDSGVDYNHPDLKDNMWVNPNEIAGNGIDDDGNGYVDDVHGINTINGSGDPMDDHNHGTHCAGTIAGRGNNSTGVTGVNWYAKIIGVKFITSSGSGSLYDAIEAIHYVTNLKIAGVDVALSSNSWGGGPYVSSMYSAIQRARDHGILFVAAAGNASNNNDGYAFYPANYNVDNVISVAAHDSSGNLASFSNYGANTVHLAAPGVSILSTIRGGYSYYNGTSMATPHVSGALALLHSFRPDLTYFQLKTILLQNTVPLASLTGRVQTNGILNLNNMLRNAPPPNGGPTPVPTYSPSPTSVPTYAPTASPTPQPSATPTSTPTSTPTPGWYDISGRISAPDGSGISGAKITITGDGNQHVTYSGANGQYSLSGLVGPRLYNVKTEMSGYTFEERYIYLTGNMTVNIEGLANQFTLSGRVITNDKSPLAGAEIVLNNKTASAVYTDSNGYFSFGVPAGLNYSLTARMNGYDFNLSDLSGTILGDVSRTFVAKER